MGKIGIIGAFDFKHMSTGGQPVKTRQLYDSLTVKYKKTDIICVETTNWKQRPFSLALGLITVFIKCDRVVMLPASNGVRIFSRILNLYKKIRKSKIYYDVIGGWLPNLLVDKPELCETLKNFNCILVETETMKTKLNKLGFENVYVLPNYKKLKCIDINDLKSCYFEPFKLCTFSRVMQEKGIEDAITAVEIINERFDRVVFELDIYGPVDEGYLESFEKMKREFPPYVKYMGIADPYESVKVLSTYFALLFPTRFYTEGIPGTIIDAYAAGIPVISAMWESSQDVISDCRTGLLFEFGKINALVEKLCEVANNPELLIEMKQNCLNEYTKYTEEYFLEQLQRFTDL